MAADESIASAGRREYVKLPRAERKVGRAERSQAMPILRLKLAKVGTSDVFRAETRDARVVAGKVGCCARSCSGQDRSGRVRTRSATITGAGSPSQTFVPDAEVGEAHKECTFSRIEWAKGELPRSTSRPHASFRRTRLATIVLQIADRRSRGTCGWDRCTGI